MLAFLGFIIGLAQGDSQTVRAQKSVYKKPKARQIDAIGSREKKKKNNYYTPLFQFERSILHSANAMCWLMFGLFTEES